MATANALPRLTQSIHIERVTLTGALLGVVALFLPFLKLRPNRIAEGTLYGLFDFAAVPVSTVLLGAVVLAVLCSLLGESPRIRIIKIGSGFLVFLAALLRLSQSNTLISQQELEFGRVTPTAGFWLYMLVTFVLVDGSLRNAPFHRLVKSVIGLVPFAVLFVFLVGGHLDHLAVMQEFHNRQQRFVQELGAHVYLAFTSVAAATAIGVPLGLLAWRRRTAEKPVFTGVNGIQTIPSLALFGLMIAPLAFLSRQFPVLREFGIQGIGNAPALIALTLYSLLPIVRNTFTSLAVIPEAVIDAGTGVGMSRRQLLHHVEVPIAAPIVLGGIRVAAVQAVGNTAVAALIGAGGFGNFVFQGLGQAAPDLIVMGVLPIIFMAVVVDRLFGVAIYQLTPPSMRTGKS
jgi:osmoprotectant transport system permease protein